MEGIQTAANGRISIFEDEELLHDIKPSFIGSLSKLDWILTILLVGFWLPVPFLRWRNTRYVITSDRLVDMQGGLTGTTTVETAYDNIAGEIRTRQGLIKGLLNRGSIEFEIEKQRSQSATEREFGNREGGTREMNITRETIELQGIRDYQEVSNTIRRLQRAE